MPDLCRMPSTERVLLACLLAATLVVRGGLLLAMRHNLQDDPDLYRRIAENLLQHGEYALAATSDEGVNATLSPTAYRPPLYPVLLSNLPTTDGQHVSLLKVGVLHVLLGVATVWLTYATARRFCKADPASGTRPPGKDAGATEVVDCQQPTPAPGGSVVAKAPRTHPTSSMATALLAGLLVACDPILLHQQTLIMTETLATFLAILALWCLVRFDAAPSWFNAGLAGGAIGLAILCRPTFLPWLGMVGLVMVVTRGGNPEFKRQNAESGTSKVRSWYRGIGFRVVNAATLGLIAAAVVSPWVIRNYREFGKPIATTTHGGYTLYLGNNWSFYQWLLHDRSGLPFDARDSDFVLSIEETGLMLHLDLPEFVGPEMPTVIALTDFSDAELAHRELLFDRLAYDLAWRAGRENRLAFVLSCAYRIGQLWSPLPHQLTADESTGRMLLRYATAIWYVGVYLLTAIGIWRLRWKLLARPWLWGVLLCLTFTAVHTFYWSNLRMRAPLMPFVALIAAAAMLPPSRQTGRN